MFFFPPAGILDIVDEDPQRNPLKASPLYEMKSHCFKPKRSCRGFLWLGSPSTELHWVRKEESIQQNEVLRLRINGTTWPLKKKNETKQGNLFYSLPLLFFFSLSTSATSLFCTIHTGTWIKGWFTSVVCPNFPRVLWMNLQQRNSPFIFLKCDAQCHSAASDMWAGNNKVLPLEIICEQPMFNCSFYSN